MNRPQMTPIRCRGMLGRMFERAMTDRKHVDRIMLAHIMRAMRREYGNYEPRLARENLFWFGYPTKRFHRWARVLELRRAK